MALDTNRSVQDEGQVSTTAKDTLTFKDGFPPL